MNVRPTLGCPRTEGGAASKKLPSRRWLPLALAAACAFLTAAPNRAMAADRGSGADRVVFLSEGVVAEEGLAHDVLTRPQHPLTARFLQIIAAERPAEASA